MPSAEYGVAGWLYPKFERNSASNDAILVSGVRAAAAAAAFRLAVARRGQHRQQRLAAHAGPVGRLELANRDLHDAREALRHDLHVRGHDRVAQPPELLHILLVDNVVELLLRDAELLEERRHGEERPEERVALHTELQVAAVGRFPRDLEPRQGENADLLLDDVLARPDRQPFPGVLALLVGLPDERSPLGHAVERVAVGEGFGIAAEDDVGVAEVAVDANTFRCADHEVRGGSALLL